MYEWKPFLKQYSAAVIANPPEYIELPEGAAAAGWLGNPPASEEQIAAAEARLGVTFPPAYRSFLAVSNGWRETGNFISAIFAVEQVEWLRDNDHHEIDAWTMVSDGGPMPDEPWRDQGGYIEAEVRDFAPMQNALLISDWGVDGEYMLLIPDKKDDEGEWEAWFFAHWIPGASRYPSFWDLMQSEYRSFLRHEVEVLDMPPAPAPSGLAANLPQLIAQLEARADAMRGQWSEDMLTKPFAPGNFEAFAVAVSDVKNLGENAVALGEAWLYAALLKTAERYEIAAYNTPFQPKVGELLRAVIDPMRMVDQLRQQRETMAYGQAAEVIRQFLGGLR
jgi:hypothetical protein